MVERFFDWRRHLVALVIALLIFIIGLLIGGRLNKERLEFTEDIINQQRADYESLQLQYALLSSDLKECSAIASALNSNLVDLEDARTKLETYSKDNEEEFDSIQREYMLTEIRYWLLARQTKKACNIDVVHVLFFYDNDERCEECGIQGTILTKLKDIFKDKLLIFSLDVSSKERMIEILRKTYNIQKTPSMVVEDNKVEGLVELGELKKKICGNYRIGGGECG